MKTRHKTFMFIILVMEALLLLLTVHRYNQPRETIQIRQEDVLLNQGSQTSAAFYIDSSTEGEIHRLETAPVVLDKGVYCVNVFFETGNPIGTGATGCRSYAQTTESYSWVRSGDVRLMDYMAPMTSYRIWVDRDDTPVQVIAELVGDYDTWLILRGADIVYYRGKTTAVQLLLILLLCLLIDIPLVFCPLLPENTRKWIGDHRMLLFGTAVITLASSVPMLSNYIMFGYDTQFHLNRIKSIAMGLESGYFPVRIQPGWLNGYGYASGLFYCDFFMYLPAVLHLIGFTMDAAFRVYVISMNLLTAGIAVYCFTKISDDHRIGLAGAAVYTLSLFRLGCVYTWCQIGTVGAMAFFPLILLGMAEIYSQENDTRQKKGWPALAIGMTGVVYSHVISVLVILCFLVAFALYMHRITFKRETLQQIGKAAAMSTALSLWYIVPFADSFFRNTLISITEYRPFSDRQIQLAQIFSNAYDPVLDQRKYSQLSSMKGNSVLTFGMMAGCILLFGLWLLISEKKTRSRFLLTAALTGAGICTWMTTDLFPWKWVQDNPLILMICDRLEYPWRFMPLGTLMIALVFVSSCMLLKEKHRGSALMLMMIICIITCVHGVQYENAYCFHAEQLKTTWDVDEVSMRSIMGGEFRLSGQRENTERGILVSDPSTVSAVIDHIDGLRIESTVLNTSGREQYLDYPRTGYYGYRAYGEDGFLLPVAIGDSATLRVIIPAEYNGKITVDFKEPAVWRIAEIFSLLTAVLWIIAAVLPCTGKSRSAPCCRPYQD